MFEIMLGTKRPVKLGPPITYIGGITYNAPKTQTIAIPLGTQAGDLMMMFFACTNQTPALPVGWTKITTYWSNGNGQLHAFLKIARANEPTFNVFQDTTTVIPMGIVVYRGASSVKSFNGGSSLNPYILPSLDVVETNSILISVIADRTPSIPLNPSPQTSRLAVMPSTTPFHGMRISDETITRVGPTTPRQSRSTGINQYAGMFLSLLIR